MNAFINIAAGLVASSLLAGVALLCPLSSQ
jgi:hypothetical protein